MKFCKRDALANYSDDLRAVIEENIALGDSLSPEAVAILEKHGIAPAPVAATGDRHGDRLPA